MLAVFCAVTMLIGSDNRSAVSGLFIEKSAYKDVVIEIRDNVPVEECGAILADLEVSFDEWSLFWIYFLL